MKLLFSGSILGIYAPPLSSTYKHKLFRACSYTKPCVCFFKPVRPMCFCFGQSQPPLPLPPCQGKEATPGGCIVHRPHIARLPRWSPGSPAQLGTSPHTPGTVSLLAGSPWRWAHPPQCCSPRTGFDVRCQLHDIIHSVTWAPCHESCRAQER